MRVDLRASGRGRVKALGIAWVLLAGACLSTETRSPISSSAEATVRHGSAVRAWNVLAGDELLGQVVRFEPPGTPEDAHYVVRNVYGQDVGLVDRLGRAYRYLPHHRDPAWVGTGSLQAGAETILGAGAPSRLEEAPLEPPRPPPE